MTQSLNDDLQHQLMVLFVAESQEHVQAISQDLLALEAGPAGEERQSLLSEALREAHSLKGAARAVNLAEVETLAHHLESLFVSLQERRQLLHPEGFDLAYQTLDSIGGLVQAMANHKPHDLNVPGLVQRVEALAEQVKAGHLPGKRAEQAPRPEVAPAEPPPEPKSAALAEAAPPAIPAAQRAPARPAMPTAPAESRVPRVHEAAQPGNEKPSTAASEGSTQAETVRLTTTKLDTLLALMGELQVARIGVGHHLSELQEIHEQLTAWETEWRRIRPQYRRLLLDVDTARTSATSEAAARLQPGRLEPLLEFMQANEIQLRALDEQTNRLVRGFLDDGRHMNQVADQLESEIRQTRMLPVSALFNAFPRMVRDMAREQAKEVALEISGDETEADRAVLEQLRDPVIHLLRNCLDHGIEGPEVRVQNGKNRQGTIRLQAGQRGDNLVIEVSDDGAGIDLAAVRAAAVKKRLLSAEQAEALNDHDALWLIFQSGLSTSPILTNLSGRGVGLDVVRRQVERLHGLLEVENSPGQGVRFTLSVPLSVATTLCLMVRAGQRPDGVAEMAGVFALPISNVVRILRMAPSEVGSVEGQTAITLEGEPLALNLLAEALDLPALPPDDTARAWPVVVVAAAEKRAAFLVDEIIGTQELVITSLPWPLLHLRDVTGAAILGSGSLVVAINPVGLLATTEQRRAQPGAGAAARVAEERPAVIMVADDSITTRTLEKNILEAAGFRVLSAADGLDAWAQMQMTPCDLLVSDVVMPNLDGIGLTEKLRASERYKHLPIILVTSLGSIKDRERGAQAGADAYIVKGAFDQDNLLETIQRLL